MEETSVVGRDNVVSKRLGGCRCSSGKPLRGYPVVYVGCVVGETRAGGVAIVMDDQSDVADNRTVAASVGDSDAVSSMAIEGEERCWDSCNRFRGYCVGNIVLGELRVSYISWRHELGCMGICSV